MKNIIILLFLLFLSSVKAEALKGAYSCPVTFPNGAFEVLMFDFSDKVEEPVFLINASQTTPNFMLIKVENEEKQQSIKMDTAEDGDYLETYQIFWKDTWYFGSTLRIHLKKLIKNGFEADIEFNDNDGFEETLESTCLKAKDTSS
jgi:hypothetical protein